MALLAFVAAGLPMAFVAAGLPMAAAAQGLGDAAPAAPGGNAAGPAAPVGTNTQAGLHDQIAAAFALGTQPVAPPTTDPAWIITPSIALQEEWTDNALQTSSPKTSSLITVITPGLSISGSTARLTANLNYAPSVVLETGVSGQNQVGQNLGGDALLTLVPDQLYVRVNGFAAEQSLGVGNAPNGTVAINRQNQVQTYDFSIEPYVTHRFGGWGSLQAGVSAEETTQGLVGNTPGAAGSQSQTTRQETASFTSGENLGRVSASALLSASQYDGTGALSGASRKQATLQGGYAITRGIVALASIGWEDIQYTGPNAPRVNDATWTIGTRLTPNPDSSITLTYGHQDGATSAQVDASYAPTVRTRLYVRYSAGLSTDTEQLQNGLAGATFDALGNPISAQTGAPLQLGNNFFGFNGNVYQLRNLSATASWLLDRDSFQISVTHQSQTPTGASTGSVIGVVEGVTVNGLPLTLTSGQASNSGTYASFAWQHQVNDALSANLFLQYGKASTNTPLGISFQTFTLLSLPKQQQQVTLMVGSVGLNYQLSRTLAGSLQYSYSRDSFRGGSQAPISSNLVVVGLRKTF